MTTNAVPSTDPADLLINAGLFDRFVNDPAPSFSDRRGETRQTIAGQSAIAAAAMAAAVISLAAFTPRGAWYAGTAYALKDVSVNGGIAYACVVPHTSGTFSSDLAAGKWIIHQGALRGDLLASPKFFGAVGDGVTDDTAAVLAAVATGRAVDLGGPENTFLISSGATLISGQHLVGAGGALKTTSNIALVTLAARCKVACVRLIGSGSGSSQHGIFIDGGASFNAVSRTSVFGCDISSMGGSGYYVTRVVDSHQGNQIVGGHIDNCTTGVQIAERGEYTTVTGVNISLCGTGIDIVGGNANVAGGVVSNCDTGIRVGAGANDAHGIVNGVLINHCTTWAIRVDAPNVKEFQFINGKSYYGGLFLDSCTGIKFQNWTFSNNSTFRFKGSLDTVFDTCTLMTLPTFEHDYAGSASKTHFIDPICDSSFNSGIGAINQNGGYVQVKRASTLALTTATTQQDIPWDSLVYNACAGQLTYTKESFVTLGTGVFNLTLFKSPKSSFYADAEIQLSIGASSGTVDYSKINVYLADATGRVIANFSPSVREYGSNPGASWKIFSLNARVPKRADLRVAVVNNTGVALSVYADASGKPCQAVFAGF